jgi:hypothetical protein
VSPVPSMSFASTCRPLTLRCQLVQTRTAAVRKRICHHHHSEVQLTGPRWLIHLDQFRGTPSQPLGGRTGQNGSRSSPLHAVLGWPAGIRIDEPCFFPSFGII